MGLEQEFCMQHCTQVSVLIGHSLEDIYDLLGTSQLKPGVENVEAIRL